VIQIPARDHMTLSPQLIPTGERTPVTAPDPMPMKGVSFGDVYTNLKTGANGRAEFSVKGKNEKVAVAYGPKFTTGVIYSVPGRNFVCFEPMTGITNGVNLANSTHYAGVATAALFITNVQSSDAIPTYSVTVSGGPRVPSRRARRMLTEEVLAMTFPEKFLSAPVAGRASARPQ
jgi:hypothetical protein